MSEPPVYQPPSLFQSIPGAPAVQSYGQAPQQPPLGQLVVELRKPFGMLSSSTISPVLTIDGYPAPARWGQNVFPVVAGQHTVQVASNYMWRYGAASLPVEIRPGQSVVAHYAGPVITFLSGRMGFEEQARPGMAVFWAILAVPVVLLVLLLVLVVGNA